MIIDISEGMTKNVLKSGKLIPVVEGRPNLSKIDMRKIKLVQVPNSEFTMISWRELVKFMELQFQQGFLTLGSREFIAILSDKKLKKWFRNDLRSNVWKMGSGGFIAFPDGLIKMPGKKPRFDMALWHESEGWNIRERDATNEKNYPLVWGSDLRLALYPLEKA